MRASVLSECKSWKDTDKRWQEQTGENLCRLENLPRQKSKSKPCKVPKQLQVRRVAPAPPAIQSDMHEICTTLPNSEQSSFALTCTILIVCHCMNSTELVLDVLWCISACHHFAYRFFQWKTSLRLRRIVGPSARRPAFSKSASSSASGGCASLGTTSTVLNGDSSDRGWKAPCDDELMRVRRQSPHIAVWWILGLCLESFQKQLGPAH